ncbi:MAG: hypothetical protein ACJ789_02330 [Thermomicrobiales bacterium]
MIRHFGHWLLIGMVVVSALVGSIRHFGSTAAQESQFAAAAATFIAQSGKVGLVYQPSRPTVCSQLSANFTGTGNKVNIFYGVYDRLSISSIPGVTYQTVQVRVQLYQRLSANKYQFLQEVPVDTTETVYAYPGPVDIEGEFLLQPAGPDYVLAYAVTWFSQSGTVDGKAVALQSQYITTLDNTGIPVIVDQPICGSAFPPEATISATTGTVNSTVAYQLKQYPLQVAVAAKWDGASIATISTTKEGTAAGTLLVPAAPMGTHKLTFTYGHWIAAKTFTVKPRIKLSPSIGLKRGQTVNVSLRGYAKYETVNIRWKNGSSFTQIAHVTTSGTGSANVSIKVPSFAIIGTNSVRGDGSYGHAQTNAVTVVASLSSSANASATPTKTPTPAPTAIPATVIPSPTATPSPTVAVTSPAPTETPTTIASPEATITATPTAVTEAATAEPTAPATAEPSPGASAPGEEAG